MPIPVTQYNPNAFYQGADFVRQNRMQDTQLQRLYQQDQQAAADRTATQERNKVIQGRQDQQYEDEMTDRERESLSKFHAPFAQAAIKSGNSREFYRQQLANPQIASLLTQDGIFEPADLDDPEFDQHVQAIAAWGAQPKAAVKWEDRPGPRGSMLQVNPETGEMRQVVGPDNSQPAAGSGRARTLSVEEMRAKGFPEGSVVQELADGRLDVVNKREGLSAAEQKTVREAKMRMPRLNAALRRVDRLGDAVAKIADNRFFDGGPADARMLALTKGGQEVDAAAAQLMPELQALTRVPGIGSQSDLEARLASLAMPSLKVAPEVNARSQAELRAFVEDLKSAYESLLQGGDQGSEVPRGTSQAAPQQGQPVRVTSPAQASQLPSGTRFVTPDGQVRVKR